MKHAWLLALLMVVVAGCAGAPDSGRGQCNQGLCVKIEVAEPVRREEPVKVTITVWTESDVPKLGVSLYTYPSSAQVQGPAGWETTAKEGTVWEGGAGWLIGARSKQPAMFTREIRLPPGESLWILANAATPQGLRVVDSVRIHFTAEGAQVYYEGTPMPITPGPILMFTVTPGPSPTPRPTFTPTPTLPPTPTHPRFPLTPTQEPYPPATALPRAPLAAPTEAAYP